jgi:hypothetical protein
LKQRGAPCEEARKNLDAFKREREKGIIGDIVEREKTISAMEGEVIKAKKRYELEQLCSPVDGTVHGISSYTIGGVVTPAQPIVTIVPDGTPLIVEAMALNKDIGFLKVGQEAEVKFDTFPFQKYGTIKERVSSISPDAFEDEKLGSVYKIRAELEKLSLMVDGRNGPVSPGMTVAVEVKTGKRRIIEFFLSPIVKYAKESLTLTQRGFDDILIPPELKLDTQKSMVVNTSTSGGVLVFNGYVDEASLIDFFLKNMNKDNWQLKGSIKYRHTVLTFEKPNKGCVITIGEKTFNTPVEIWVGILHEPSTGQLPLRQRGFS